MPLTFEHYLAAVQHCRTFGLSLDSIQRVGFREWMVQP